jgi:hypothetical protein
MLQVMEDVCVRRHFSDDLSLFDLTHRIRELQTLGSACQELFGIIGNREHNDFENLFTWQDEEEQEEHASLASSAFDDDND